MGDETSIQFTDRGYRQLVMALREARPAPSEPPPPLEFETLTNNGEAGFVDPQGHIRWVKPDRVPEVPATWRPLLIGPSAAEAAKR